MRKFLVSGGMGFIGSNFIHYILNKYEDYQVTNLDLLTYAGNENNLKELNLNPNYNFVKGDILDVQLVESLVKGHDIVANFAAETHVDRSIEDPMIFAVTNVLGTQVLLNACLTNKVRFHQVSSDEVFGDLPLDSDERFDENSLYKPSSPYAASKASADHFVRAYNRTFGLETTISNCSNNYGRYQNPEKLIPRMIIKAMNDEKLPIYGEGKNIRDWIHVEDHCVAIDLIIHEGKIGETYLVGGDAEFSNREVAKKILSILEKDENLIEYVEDRLGHDLRYAIDSSKIEKKLGWKRKYDFEGGLKETIDWYVQNSDW